MVGSIIGDICGSTYEYKEFDINKINLFVNNSKFTDDTILTISIADVLLKNKNKKLTDKELLKQITKSIKKYAKRYPEAGYGSKFKEWLNSKSLDGYESYGNGGAMRISAIPYIYDNIEDILKYTELTTSTTHNSEKGIIGAKAIAHSIYLAKNKYSKEDIKRIIESEYKYDLNEYVLIDKKFNCLAETTVPNAIISFLKSNSFEETLINSIKLQGDTDTIACMSGGIAEAYYGLDLIENKFIKLLNKLPNHYLNIIKEVYLITNKNFNLIK